MSDAVDHPKHYNEHPSGIECIDIVRHMNFNLGNVMKYIWRAGLKDEQPTIQDLKKAMWYLNDEINTRILEENGGDQTLLDACERFHPGEKCIPGQNHPSASRTEDD